MAIENKLTSDLFLIADCIHLLGRLYTVRCDRRCCTAKENCHFVILFVQVFFFVLALGFHVTSGIVS